LIAYYYISGTSIW